MEFISIDEAVCAIECAYYGTGRSVYKDGATHISEVASILLAAIGDDKDCELQWYEKCSTTHSPLKIEQVAIDGLGFLRDLVEWDGRVNTYPTEPGIEDELSCSHSELGSNAYMAPDNKTSEMELKRSGLDLVESRINTIGFEIVNLVNFLKKMEIKFDYDFFEHAIHENCARDKRAAPLDLNTHRTTLSRYIELELWTQDQAACLVAGLIPDTVECNELSFNARSLCGYLVRAEKYDISIGKASADTDLMTDATRLFVTKQHVLMRLEGQANPPEKVKPTDFVTWCELRGIDTTWLTSTGELIGASSISSKKKVEAIKTVICNEDDQLLDTREMVNEICDNLLESGDKVTIQSVWIEVCNYENVTRGDKGTVIMKSKVMNNDHKVTRRTIQNNITKWRKAHEKTHEIK